MLWTLVCEGRACAGDHDSGPDQVSPLSRSPGTFIWLSSHNSSYHLLRPTTSQHSAGDPPHLATQQVQVYIANSPIRKLTEDRRPAQGGPLPSSKATEFWSGSAPEWVLSKAELRWGCSSAVIWGDARADLYVSAPSFAEVQATHLRRLCAEGNVDPNASTCSS